MDFKDSGMRLVPNARGSMARTCSGTNDMTKDSSYRPIPCNRHITINPLHMRGWGGEAGDGGWGGAQRFV